MKPLYIYNLGQFRLMYGHTVYYMLFGFIKIKITEFRGGNNNQRLKLFHQIVNGFETW